MSTVEDLQEYLHQVSPQRRAKRGWAKDLPERPGVYWFCSDQLGDSEKHVLYVGKSKNLRRRVGTYFTASETRPRMEEMIRVATGVEHIVCVTDLEADVRELRLIAAHAPRYNRRSKFPQKVQWLKLTVEPYPRLGLVREIRPDDATYVGPFSSRAVAEQVMLALYEAVPIRQCSGRLSPRKATARCALADLGRCAAPCDHTVNREQYAAIVDEVRSALLADTRPVLSAAQTKLRRLIQQERFEEALSVRARLETFSRSVLRHHRVASLARVPEIVAARRVEKGWEIHVIRHGRLAAAAFAHLHDVPQAVARQALLTAETVLPPVGPQPAATIEETEQIATWLELPGVRFIGIEGDWTWPRRIVLPEGELARQALGVQPLSEPLVTDAVVIPAAVTEGVVARAS